MTPEETLAVELRAVEIAYAVYNKEPIDQTGRELAGWMRYADNREPRIKKTHAQELEWHAGWLACHIWDGLIHNEDGSIKTELLTNLDRPEKRAVTEGVSSNGRR